jgi:TATA-box binding protein (TBP) (component of TFIID and TFIIIB)
MNYENQIVKRPVRLFSHRIEAYCGEQWNGVSGKAEKYSIYRCMSLMARTSIVNVVATAALGQKLDLEELGKRPQILHNAHTYGGRVAYFRSRLFKGEVSIFSSRKMISAGTKSEAEAFHALECAKGFLTKEGFVETLRLKKEMQNMVLVADLGKEVNLESLAENCKMIYEPGQFPSGILRMDEFGVTALVYASGKVVIEV